MKTSTVIYSILILIIIGVIVYFFVTNGGGMGVMEGTNGTSTATSTATTSTSTNATTSEGNMTTQIKLAYLDTEGSTTGPERGCDRVVMVPQTISATPAPLTAAMQALFANNQERVNGWYNFISKTNDTLKFDHATVVDGTANIYLTGSLSGLGGVCDDPRASTQIDETALQFPTVKTVQIYLNGSSTSLIPSEKGV